MDIKIKINERNRTVIDFDIVGFGNVLMDYEYGTFDCYSFDDNIESDEEFRQMILDNIDIIIKTISIPTLEKAREQVDLIKDLVYIANPFKSTDNIKKTYNNWSSKLLPVLIEAEDYERCQVIIDFKNKLL